MLYQTLFVLASVISISNNVEAYHGGRALLSDDLMESLESSTAAPDSPDGTGSSDSSDMPSTTGSSDSDSSSSESGSDSTSGSDSDGSGSDSTSVSRSVSDDENNNSIDDDVEQFSVDSSGNVVGSPDSDDDLDNDGVTNSQDSDVDGDGIPNDQDSDDDDDGVPDSQDNDDDNDGVSDSTEARARRAGVIDGDYESGYFAAEKAAKATTSELYTVIGVLGGIIGALLIVVGGSAYYFYQKNMKENEDVNRAVEMVDVEANAMPQTFTPNNGEFRAEDPMIISQQ